MTDRQREHLAGLREANQRIALARVGTQRLSRFTGYPTPLAAAVRHRNNVIAEAVEAGVPPVLIADECRIASVDRVRRIAEIRA